MTCVVVREGCFVSCGVVRGSIMSGCNDDISNCITTGRYNGIHEEDGNILKSIIDKFISKIK